MVWLHREIASHATLLRGRGPPLSMSRQNHASKSGSLLGGCCGCGGPSSREIDRVRSRFGLKTDADIQHAGGTIVSSSHGASVIQYF